MSNGMHMWLGHPVAVILGAVPHFLTDEEGDVGTPAGLGVGTAAASHQATHTFLVRLAAVPMRGRPGRTIPAVSRSRRRPDIASITSPACASTLTVLTREAVVLLSDSGATTDRLGRAQAARLQQANPYWDVMYALFWRKLVAIYMGPTAEPIILSDEDPAELEQSMRDIVLTPHTAW
jgi:hypothetical protein